MYIFSSREPDSWLDAVEPTDAELMAIEAEWPSIEADLILLDVELSRQSSDAQIHRQARRSTRRVLSGSARTAVSS